MRRNRKEDRRREEEIYKFPFFNVTARDQKTHLLNSILQADDSPTRFPVSSREDDSFYVLNII